MSDSVVRAGLPETVEGAGCVYIWKWRFPAGRNSQHDYPEVQAESGVGGVFAMVLRAVVDRLFMLCFNFYFS